jgi:hypothetical protein
MRKTGLWGILFSLLALWGCGGDGNGLRDADADAAPDPDFVFEEVPDVAPEETVDLPVDETSDPAGDEPSDGSDCPAPPACEDPLVLGVENALDENDCPTGYCCTGIVVTLEGVHVMSTAALAVGGSGSAMNAGEVDVMTATLDCEIRNPADDSVVASCETIPVVSETPLEVDASAPFEFSPVCTIEGLEPCFDPVDVVCTASWETIGCYSSGSAVVTVTVDYNCGV